MTVDEAIYRNTMHLLEKNGISERNCALSCGLCVNFFSNYRNKKFRHFKVCDIAKIASLFEVSMDYLCDCKNSNDDFFKPKYKLRRRDEKVMMTAFRKLDRESRVYVAGFINEEMKNTKAREKSRGGRKKGM